MNKNDLYLDYEGQVIQKLPDNFFKIEVLKGAVKIITANIANRLKSTDRRWKRIAEGDKVKVKIPLGDLTKGWIIEILD